jgi:hypothetical protein
MRFALITTLSTLTILAAVSIASAEKVLKPGREVTIAKPPADAPYGGLTPKEHASIPYQPCIDPSPRWVNGRLQCDNRR